MKNVTLDTNCIIDLEEERKAASCIRALIQKHEEDRIKLRVVAIAASERKPDGTYASHFNEFKQKMAAIGLGGIEILKPMGYWGATFWDWGLWTNDEMVAFERQIHEILFPEIEFEYEEYCRMRGLDIKDEVVDRKWRNAKCDVLGLWSHIHYQGDIFVTSDANFHKQTKKPALISLGAGEILTPQEAMARLR